MEPDGVQVDFEFSVLLLYKRTQSALLINQSLEEAGFMPFPKALARSKRKSKIWTWLHDFVFHADNRYTILIEN